MIHSSWKRQFYVAVLRNILRVKHFLTFWAPTPQNGQIQSNKSSAIFRQIVWVCLTILLVWRLKGYNKARIIYRRKGSDSLVKYRNHC